mmetsp:Transcript_1751/g.5328  ORF Transcript_1751/g.5328 Transcript_1751/m.5328 type:complete len:90 (+) Transcript_1751:519-788(+)
MQMFSLPCYSGGGRSYLHRRYVKVSWNLIGTIRKALVNVWIELPCMSCLSKGEISLAQQAISESSAQDKVGKYSATEVPALFRCIHKEV